MTPALLQNVPGGPELIEWFGGYAPRFHDAEVLGLTLDREAHRDVADFDLEGPTLAIQISLQEIPATNPSCRSAFGRLAALIT